MPLQIIKSKIGNAEVFQIVECEIGFTLPSLLPDATQEKIKEIEWLKAPHINEDYSMNAVSQSFIVKLNNRLLVLDTCIGNDKIVEGAEDFTNMKLEYLEALETAGIDRTQVTDVFCSHLHFDHVGWNTYKQGGKWLPTFPNAKYHFAKGEYDYWKNESDNDPMKPIEDTSFKESVDPIVEAGLVNFIDVNTDLGDGFQVISTPGHTKSHVSLLVDAGKEKFILGGDMSHHQCQLANPDWAQTMDYDQKQSSETRRKVLTELNGTSTLFTCTHYTSPSFGKITKDANGKFVFNVVSKEIK
ncbi:MBL fold metallo-hydrolase [Pedobacter insulae]|uniref:Metallo-beta-lactamase superfamily protein n=1 Tax=Pedobacter insulae TaxID=414048 RepID=A0A1I2WYE9_9SPHI|nr:MBL fold metallo-hydrolase [Pedobacter insulae]SFH06364.1 Metallo-beta-lactamase superfamily protein [Pedobacter insulae]